MRELPDGTVTFLFTDIQGSTRLWEEAPDLMGPALDQHDEVIDTAVAANGGFSVKPRGEGDSRFIVFVSAVDAVAAVAKMQISLATADWATPRPVQVRASLHTGEADLKLGDYYGPAVNRAARLRAIAHGGQTVISQATWTLTQDRLPTGITLRDMGEHGLKDLTQPEHVYQVDIEGLPTEFPPLTSLGAIPNNLPVQLTEFVGREMEVADVCRIIGETRLLTLLAPGGAGKTRLAIQSAAEISDDFPDGVFFVDLASISMADDIVQTVAESIGIALSTADDPLNQLVAYLKRKTQLLVMDNFEHVSDGAGIVSSILKGALDVRVLATSRSKLNIEGETVMSLGGLETAWESQQEAMETSSVELFLGSARRANASFALSGDDLEPLAKILQLVDGMPLAINLAAAWVDMLSLADIATEITATLDFLESETGGVVDRHRSVRAVFDYSWKMLGEEERRLFAALSVFRGGFTREAAQEVAGASMRALANLANKALLVADRSSNRYQVHELLRQYAEAELRSDPERWEATVEAHIAFYAAVAGRSRYEIGKTDQAVLLGIVEADIENLRLAWRTAVDRRDGAALRTLVFGLFFHHVVKGWYQAGMGLIDEYFESIPTSPTDENGAIVHAALTAEKGRFLAMLGQPELTLDLTGAAIRALSELPDRFSHLHAIEAHCDGLAFAGDWDAIHAVNTEGARMAEQSGHLWWEVSMLTWMGMSDLMRGNPETGMSTLAEAAEKVARLNDEYLTIWNLIARGTIARMTEQGHDAVAMFQEVVTRSRSIGFGQSLQIGLQSVGEVSLEIGEPHTANLAFHEALVKADDMGMVNSRAFALIKIAEVRAAMGNQDQAVEIAASVMADPVHEQRIPTHEATIGEEGSMVLDKCRSSMEASAYEAAYARGQIKTVEVTAKELLAETGVA